MTLTEEQLRIISENPLNQTLHHITLPGQEDVSRITSLLGGLLGSRAAFNLTFPDESVSVTIKLFSLLEVLHLRQDGGDQATFDQLRPLLQLVIDKSPDLAIWTEVFRVLKASIPQTFNGTPVKSNSSRLADSETREIIEGELFEEIKACTFRDVRGFCDKFFRPEGCSKEQQEMLQVLMAEHDRKRWTRFPSTPDEKPVWDWLKSLEKDALPNARYRLETTSTASQFKERKGQMDLFYHLRSEDSNDFKYKNVLVVREQKKSYDKSRFKADLLQLARYVRSIFAAQPTRRFVHGFTLCASVMEAWVFDRSGAYSSGPFDIHEKPETFARALVSYATMDDRAMGLDIFTQKEHSGRFIVLDDAKEMEKRIELEEVIVWQKAIVSRGTTCFLTSENSVAKFAWASDKRKLEVEHLKLAESRGVEGLAKLIAHRQITSIKELREGLDFPARHRFRNEDAQAGSPSSAQARLSMNSRKRKSSSAHASSSLSGLKRQRSAATTPSLYRPGDDQWDNRIYSCLVISPAGRVISEFQTIKELLLAIRDAIKARRSLFQKGHILHRDISSNNIIITRPETENGFYGMLIDLDLAKDLKSGPSGARHQTGTMQFMAVEVLRTVDHTYRHDLESFFYVLLWMCARQSWHNGFAGDEIPVQESLTRRWEIGSFRVIADAKEGHMAPNGFKRLMEEFPEALTAMKPLCLQIRKILFPLDSEGIMSIGTPTGESDVLYEPIIAAYENAIGSL